MAMALHGAPALRAPAAPAARSGGAPGPRSQPRLCAGSGAVRFGAEGGVWVVCAGFLGRRCAPAVVARPHAARPAARTAAAPTVACAPDLSCPPRLCLHGAAVAQKMRRLPRCGG